MLSSFEDPLSCPHLNPSGVILLDFCAHLRFFITNTMFRDKGVHMCMWHHRLQFDERRCSHIESKWALLRAFILEAADRCCGRKVAQVGLVSGEDWTPPGLTFFPNSLRNFYGQNF